MPVLFDITYTCATSAVLGELYYRHLQPDGTYSPWVLNNGLGTFPINTSGGLVTTQLLNDVFGNPPEFYPATAYEFYVKQICADETEVDSPISSQIWVEDCPVYTINVVPDNLNTGYMFEVTFFDFQFGGVMNWNSTSISTYNFEFYNLNPTASNPTGYLGSVPILYTAIQANPNATSYTFYVTSSDLAEPIVPSVYEVTMTVQFLTSSGVQSFTCDPVTDVLVSECDTFEITTSKNWSLEWVDCAPNLPVRKISGSLPQKFYVCAKQVPKGYACISSGPNLFQDPPRYNNGQVIHPIGQCVPSTWTLPAGLTIDSGAVVKCVASSPSGCDIVLYGYDVLDDLPTANPPGQGVIFGPGIC